jgi:hypothetical protein
MIIIDINLTFYFIINKYDYSVRLMLFSLSVLIFAVKIFMITINILPKLYKNIHSPRVFFLFFFILISRFSISPFSNKLTYNLV